MRGQDKFLAFWAPKGVLSFFYHKFLGIPSPNLNNKAIVFNYLNCRLSIFRV